MQGMKLKQTKWLLTTCALLAAVSLSAADPNATNRPPVKRTAAKQGVAKATTGPWVADPGWQSCQAAVVRLWAVRCKLNGQSQANDFMRRAKADMGENCAQELRVTVSLNSQLAKLDKDIAQLQASQVRIEAAYRVRAAAQK